METAIQEIIAAAREAKQNGWKTIHYQFKAGERETFETEITTEIQNRIGLRVKKDEGNHIEFRLN